MPAVRKSWEEFSVRAYPIIHQHFQARKRSPTTTELKKKDHYWIVVRAQAFGGYPASLIRLGFPPASVPRVPRSTYRPRGYWLDDENVRRELVKHFSDLLGWETLPSMRMIFKKVPGLGSMILRRDSVSELAQRLGFMTYLQGMRYRRRVEGVDWALTFNRDHHRWPFASECPSGVRMTKFVRGTTWIQFCRPSKLPRGALMHLLNVYENHRPWIDRQGTLGSVQLQEARLRLATEYVRRFTPLD